MRLVVLTLALGTLGCVAPVPIVPVPPPNYFCQPVTAHTTNGRDLFGLWCRPQKMKPEDVSTGQPIAGP